VKAIVLSHRFGKQVIEASVLNEVIAAVNGCPHDPKRGNTASVRNHILDALSRQGWTKELELDRQSAITITSIKQRVGLCLQTGNMSRMYADLLKLQAIYLRGVIDSAIMLLPTSEAAKRFGSNVANQERLLRELAIFERVITVPMAIIGIDRGDK